MQFIRDNPKSLAISIAGVIQHQGGMTHNQTEIRCKLEKWETRTGNKAQ